MKRQNIYKGFFNRWPDEFSHHFACWAANHNGWSKAKKAKKRIAKKREKRDWKSKISEDIDEG